MKKLYIYLISSAFFSVLLVLVLFLVYHHKQQLVSYNFNRNLKDIVKNIKPFDIRYNSYYFAGTSGADHYLGNSTAALHLLKVNSQLTESQYLEIKVEEKDLKSTGTYKVHIDSSDFYMFNGVSRSILRGKVGLWKAAAETISSPYFSQSIAISDSSVIFRYVSTKTNSNSISKVSFSSQSIHNENLLEKQVDGLFCTDGLLRYNKQLKKLVYLYFYRNQMLVIDTNLNLVRKIRTIDPIDSVKFTVLSVKSDNSVKLASPALLVNANCSVWNNLMFVQSKLMGRHEDETFFRNSTVIDVYNLEKGTYLYSFYLPFFKDNPITQFQVSDNYILTLSGHYIVKYAISFPKEGNI